VKFPLADVKLLATLADVRLKSKEVKFLNNKTFKITDAFDFQSDTLRPRTNQN